MIWGSGLRGEIAARRGVVRKAQWGAWLLGAMALAGCSDEQGGGTPATPDGGARELPESVLEINSTSACRIDEECAADLHCFQGACVWECSNEVACESGDACSPRRRCVAGEQDGAGGIAKAATPEILPGITVTQPPPEVLRVLPGQSEAKVTIKTGAPVPGGSIGYTIESYSYDERETRSPSQLFRAKGSDTFELVVPTSGADPEREVSSVVEVQIVTSIGSFRLRLQPKPSASGRYAGSANVARFGSVGMPLDFEILTEPAGAELAEAERAYLVLPVGVGSIYSPVAPSAGGPTAIRAALTFRDFDQRWVATFRAPFAFSSDSLLSSYGAGQVIRGLRFELEPQGRGFTGTLRDSWEGLFDARTSDGVVSRGTVVFQGSIDVQRAGPARGLDQLPMTVADSTASVAARPLPDVAGACADDTLFQVPDVTVASTSMSCSGITDAEAFVAASASERAACAVAVAEEALAQPNTTSKQIADFLAGTSSGSESFSEFMTRCAAGTGGACRPSTQVLCGRALTAYAAATELAPGASFGPLFDAYTRVTREAFLGRQLAAYQADADTRLAWLKAQNYPAVVTAAVRDLNEQLISAWRENVLEAHFGSLGGQYDDAGLAVLARQVQDATLADQRRLLLMEMTQSWRSAMEGLSVATTRWNDVHQGDVARGEAASFVSGKAFDLYVMSGLVDELNVAAGSGYASYGIAAGFANLLGELRRLTLPFNALIFDRDAEVVVSRSLNPLSTDDTLLGEIQGKATAELERATSMVDAILARAQRQAVDEQLLRDDLNNQIDQQFDDLITLCGMPNACSKADREKPECWPSVKLGECGFGLDVQNLGTAAAPTLKTSVSGWSNTSDAAEALLEWQKASAALTDSQLALSSYRSVTTQMLNTNKARADEIQKLLELADETQAEVDVLLAEFETLEDDQIAQVQRVLMMTKMTRDKALTERRAAVMNVNNLRREGTTASLTDLRIGAGLTQTSTTIRAAADRAEHLVEMFVEGVPDTPDNISAPLKAAMKMATSGATSIMDIAAQGLEIAAAALEVEREARDRLNADELEMLNANIELEMQQRENELADLEASLELSAIKNETARARAQAAIDVLWAGLDYEMVVARDLAQLYSRRDDIHARIVGEHDRAAAVQQARLTVLQKEVAYASVVQRAQLLDGRLRNLVEQRKLINLNLGSPSVVFGWATQLEQAETRLKRAKDKLMDWVVALEYLAVRPFMDARVQILLARNTHQLQQIADSLVDIQGRCGGAINTNTSIVSLRDDILRIDSSLRDTATGEVLSPSETFRTVLQRGNIPVDTRVRFSADQTIGDLIRRGGVWAASFDLSLSDFANLAASCNAKVEEIAIELVGTDLGAAQPTVGLAYDGTSSVRSCQPDIGEIVAAIGPDATAFGPVTLFRTPGRVLAPVAGIGQFGEPNRTLVGLPLSSHYTVIIDPTLGENQRINWNNLEDVRISLRYGYQDLYPKGQCY